MAEVKEVPAELIDGDANGALPLTHYADVATASAAQHSLENSDAMDAGAAIACAGGGSEMAGAAAQQ